MTAEQALELIVIGRSIYALLGFAVIVSAGGLVTYWILKPLLIFLKGGYL